MTYLGDDITKALTYPWSRNKINPTNIEDIYDGEIYKQANILNQATITLKHNMDGISVFHSSTKDVWPIFFQLNELPPYMRYYNKDIA